MKHKNLIITSLSCVIVFYVAYAYNFLEISNLSFSKKNEDWGYFGSYIGGTITPILSFFTILILIHSLSEQVSANKALTEDIANNKRTEKLRSFDSLFFNMIKIQKDFYDNLEVDKKFCENQMLVII
jgi:hypothetical protein